MSASAPVPTIDGVDLAGVDFLDLGSSRGGSLAYCARAFGDIVGLGVDLDPAKVAEARSLGLNVVVGDATALSLSRGVRFVSMFDFLEHLPSLDHVEQVLSASAAAATDFLWIRHPSFEAKPYLASLGLRQYWWDWTGHRAHITVDDYRRMLKWLGLTDFVIRYHKQVLSSEHPSIHSVESPRNSHPYDAKVHPPKPLVHFSEQVWRAQEIVVFLRDLAPEQARSILTQIAE